MSESGFIWIKESAAAAWGTSDNLMDKSLDSDIKKNVPIPRILRSVGFIGGAAEMNTKLSIRVGSSTKSVVYNTGTTAIDYSADMAKVDIPIPAGADLSLNISAASGTNPFYVVLDIDDAPEVKAFSIGLASQQGKKAAYRRRY